jgi:hypothetical protein
MSGLITEHNSIVRLWRDFNDDPAVREAFAESGDLQEGSGAPEGRADFPIFLQSVIRRRMRERFTAVASKWRSYMGIESAQDFRENTVAQLNGLAGIEGVNENGEYPRLRTDEEAGPSFAVGKHGGTYAVTMELVINDEANVILNRTPREMGRAMAEYTSRVVVAFIESNPTYGPDGLPFFGSGHANEVTGAPANPNETNLMAALDTMQLQRDKNGVPYTVQPNRILVRTPSQKATFDRIIRSQITGVVDTAVTNSNLNYGQFFTGNYNPAYNVLPPDAVVDEPWFNDPNDYYILGNAQDRAPFVIAFLRGRQEPFIGLKDPGVRDVMGAGSDPNSWFFDHIDYKIRHFFGVAPGEPKAAMRMRPQ